MQFHTITCYKCKERFGMADDTYSHLKRSSQGFWCPNGHEQHFRPGKTDAQILQEQLDEERRRVQRLEQRQAMLEYDREAAERSARAYKGQATRLRNRAAAGVCPCCNRSFANLRTHMSKQHPGFAKLELVAENG